MPPNSEKKSVAIEGAEMWPLAVEVVLAVVMGGKSSVQVKRELWGGWVDPLEDGTILGGGSNGVWSYKFSLGYSKHKELIRASC